MADAGGANTWYIERPDQAADVFAEELEGLLTLCAQTVSVEIRPSDAVTLTAIRHQYPTTTLGTGGARLELGDVYAREPKSVLVEFFVPGLPDVGSDERDIAVAQIALTAHVLTEGGGVERQEIDVPDRHAPLGGGTRGAGRAARDAAARCSESSRGRTSHAGRGRLRRRGLNASCHVNEDGHSSAAAWAGVR